MNFIQKLLISILKKTGFEFKEPETKEIYIEIEKQMPNGKEETPGPTKADFYNNKWPRKPITYLGRILKKDTNKFLQMPILQCECDVRAFILDEDEMMKRQIVRHTLDKYNDGKLRYGNKSGLDCDATMMAIQKLICSPMEKSEIVDNKITIVERKFLDYTSDVDENDTYEFWQFPFETLKSGHGDCEDGAILIASLAINAGVPSYRVKVAAGNVSNRFHLNKDAPSFEEVPIGKYDYKGVSEGGHAYCIYLASDDEWRIIDWCYYQDPEVSMLEKPLAKKGGFGGCYLDTWFTFNNEFSWNQTALEINGKLDDVDTVADIIVKE